MATIKGNYEYSEGFAVSVNAVDIDWNGAVLKIAQ